MENPFKDAQFVAVSANDVVPDLIYIDDDELEPRISDITTVKMDLKDKKRSSTPFNDSDNENPIDIKITPMEHQELLARETSSNDCESFRSCIVDNDFLVNLKEINSDCRIQDQEQFEIVEPLEKDSSTSTNDSTRANKSNEESNDHSYSQPSVNTNSNFCDDIVRNILIDTKFQDNTNALKLLKEYTKFFENFIFKDDDSSQLSLYLKQIMEFLESNEKSLLAKKATNVETKSLQDETKEQNGHSDDKSEEESSKDEVNKEQGSEDIQMPIIRSEEVQIKQEMIESNTGTIAEHKDENKISLNIEEEAEKLKVYVRKVQDKTANFSEENQKLVESVFVSDEDIDNGNSKFKASLSNFISFNVELLMDIEGKVDSTTVNDEINKIKDQISKSRRSSSDRLNNGDGDVPSISRKSSTEKKAKRSSQSSSMSSDNESDSSINRLINLYNLNQKSKKYEKTQNTQEKPSKGTQKVKKKTKENSDDSSVNSDLSSESESEESSKIDEKKKEDDVATSEDEENKMNQKKEMISFKNLLASSDEDESSYATSETSSFSSDEEVVSAKKKPLRKLESSQEAEDEPKESESTISVNMDVEIKESTTDVELVPTTPEKENDDERKAKKRQRSSFDREVFDKNLLADSDSEKESDNDLEISQSSKKPRKNSKAESEEIIKRPINIKADSKAPTLERYIEKLSSSNVLDLTGLQEVASSSTKEIDSSPKKTDQKSKAPSPVIDDIDCISISSESDSEISSTISEGPTRRRKQLTEEELKEETKKAKKDESERVKKLEAKEQRMSQYVSQRVSQSDIIATDELVLDFSDDKDLAIVVHQGLVGRLKVHQVDGIKFMYNNCYGSVDEVKEHNGSGCILAHCMGLGKTLQLIALLHTVIRYPELHTKRILIICPKSTIHNWAEEFRKWLHGLDNRPVVIYLEDNLKIERRIDKLREWFESKKPSVFLINYESFRILENWSGSNKRSKISLPEETIKKYKQQISKYLLDPGPHLVVCDEGHIIKNQKGATNRAITKVKTKRRIILTGTPVQNALHEYYAMVEWIKPNILGTIHEFNNIYANPIKDGQNKDSTDHQIKKMKQKSYVLNKNLSRFVQRKDAQVLKEFLPKKYEYCISVPLSKVQEKLYNHYLTANRSEHMGKQLLPIYTGLRKIWTHPTVLQYAYERARRGENKFGNTNQPKKDEQKSKNVFNEDLCDEPDDIFDTSQGTTAVTNNWWNSLVTETDMNSLRSSHKMMLLFEILRLCEIKNEKLLIFSSFVAVLDIIERFMRAIHNQEHNPNAKLYGLEKYKTTWELGKDYYRLDGSTPRNVRQEMINAFNNSTSPRLRCFLISAKAGGQGINLTAANRCIIVDTSWNPANDNQNIFRIFRLGQKKTCFVYRLVACCSMEERVYSRSVTKEAMSHRVVEKKQIDRHYGRTELEELFVPYELKPREETPNFPDDDILRYLLHALPNSAYTYHEHDSLLENKPDQELNEDEKSEAWNTYLAELQGNRHQLQNTNMNVNPQTMGLFGKTPLSNDFMKLYQDMMGTPSNYLAGMMPSTSLSGLDQLGLNSSYFPNYYSHDLLKRFGNYDPLSIYSSNVLPTSSALHSTSNSSPLMQSVLRNSHNPISALGNMTVGATSSYNANNIPPASNSMFAQPTTSGTSVGNQAVVTPNLMPYTPSPAGNKYDKSLGKYRKKASSSKNPADYVIHDRNKLIARPTLNLPKRLSKDQQITTPNSSENVSILPDDDHFTPPPDDLPANLLKSIAGTSARTHQTPKTATQAMLGKRSVMKKLVLDSDTRSLIRPTMLVKANAPNKNQAATTPLNVVFPTASTTQNTVIQKIQTPVNKSAPVYQLSKSNSGVELRKVIGTGSPLQQQQPSQTKVTMVGSGNKQMMTVSPAVKTINKNQVVKGQTQLRQQLQQASNIGSPFGNDSVSVIRLPPKNVVQVQSKSPQVAVAPKNVYQVVNKSPIAAQMTQKALNATQNMQLTPKALNTSLNVQPQKSANIQVQKSLNISPNVQAQKALNTSVNIQAQKALNSSVSFQAQKAPNALANVQVQKSLNMSPNLQAQKSLNMSTNVQAQKSLNISPNVQAQKSLNMSTNIQSQQRPSNSTQNIQKILKQQQKRIIDNQTNQTLKRMRPDSQILSQSSNSQQLNTQRIILPALATQQQSQATKQPRIVKRQTMQQRIATQAPQSIQNLSVRGSNSSQSANKNPPTQVSEVVELD